LKEKICRLAADNRVCTCLKITFLIWFCLRPHFPKTLITSFTMSLSATTDCKLFSKWFHGRLSKFSRRKGNKKAHQLSWNYEITSIR
jgi:hypothetical protein